MAGQITVNGILPSYAYNDLKEAPESETVFSTHRLTWRGLQNAIKLDRALHQDYTISHGNGAAHRIRISTVGFTGTSQYWSEMAAATNGELTREAVVSYEKWLAEEEVRDAVRYAEEMRRLDEEWTRDEHGNWMEVA